MLNKIDSKIKQAISTNKLNLEILGERNWYHYYIRVTELIWLRNNHDGYKIEVYTEQHGNHLTTLII